MLKHFYYGLAIVAALMITPSCKHNTPEQDGLGCHHNHGSHDHEHEHDHDHEGHNHEDHEGHDHENCEHDHEGHDHESHSHSEHSSHQHSGEEISLDSHRAKEFGVEVVEINPNEFSDVVKVSGQIESAPTDRSVISATSSGIISFRPGISEGSQVSNGTVIATVSARGLAGGDSNEAATIALEAAKRELDRVTPLHAEGIISTKDFNAIKQAYETARAAATGNSTGSSAVAHQNGVITQLLAKQGEFVQTGQPIAVVSGSTRLTLRADLPEKYYNFLPTVATANFRPSYSTDILSLSDLNGKLVSGKSTSVATQTGYLPVYFNFDNNGSAVPGSYAEIYLIGAKRAGVLAVPASSISEQQGAHFVYVQLDDDCYEKKAVKLGRSNGRDIEILSGIEPGDKVVSKGVTFVKLAETSNVVPEGHSHTH